jgi:hypothetical protein
MFPRTEASDPRPSRWAAMLRHSLDLVVAFATLRDPEPPPSGAPASAAAAPGPALRRARAGHPHRRPLQPPVRARRPGALPAPSQPCLTPLAARRARRAEGPAART